jgi:hypothetical protein
LRRHRRGLGALEERRLGLAAHRCVACTQPQPGAAHVDGEAQHVDHLLQRRLALALRAPGHQRRQIHARAVVAGRAGLEAQERAMHAHGRVLRGREDHGRGDARLGRHPRRQRRQVANREQRGALAQHQNGPHLDHVIDQIAGVDRLADLGGAAHAAEDHVPGRDLSSSRVFSTRPAAGGGAGNGPGGLGAAVLQPAARTSSKQATQEPRRECIGAHVITDGAAPGSRQ